MRLSQISQYVTIKAKSLGQKVVYAVLLLWYAYYRDETPGWARRIIQGALAYLVNPFDGVNDLTPFIGYTDDWGVISFALVTIACYINNDIRRQARTKLQQWFGPINESELDEVDNIV